MLALASAGIVTGSIPSIASASGSASLPASVLRVAPPMQQVGKGTQNYFGLRVYRVTLWAVNNQWNPDEPHALDLESNRAVSRDQLIGAGIDEFNRLGVGTQSQRQEWRRKMERVMPSVKRGDQLVVYCAPNHKTFFYYNDRERGQIDDPSFGPAFFSIGSTPAPTTPRCASHC